MHICPMTRITRTKSINAINVERLLYSRRKNRRKHTRKIKDIYGRKGLYAQVAIQLTITSIRKYTVSKNKLEVNIKVVQLMVQLLRSGSVCLRNYHTYGKPQDKAKVAMLEKMVEKNA